MVIKLKLPPFKKKSHEEEQAEFQQKQDEWNLHYWNCYEVYRDRNDLYEKIRKLEEENAKLRSQMEQQNPAIQYTIDEINFLRQQLEMLNKYLAAAKKYNDLEKDFDGNVNNNLQKDS